MLDAIGYFKASNTWPNDSFGVAVAVSADGGTLAVGAVGEDSGATGINGDQYDDSRLYESAGAVYVFRLDGTDWSQQAYVKASNTGLINLSGRADYFGNAVALSADGNTLVVGAPLEDSNATGINGDQNDNSVDGSGAVYVFRFNGADWIQQAYVKASNTQSGDLFGWSVAISSDSNTLAVNYSDAVSVFRFDGSDWSQQAYIQSANTESGDSFGLSLALSTDGNTLAVGAYREDSNATGINGNQNDNSADRAGAAYVFRSDGTSWTQQAYIKASNTQPIDFFGSSVALSSDGNTLAVGAYGEDSIATGINGVQSGNDLHSLAGAAYVFRFDGADWSQQAYAKASNTQANAYFGHAVALSADGNILAISAPQEASLSIGVGGDQSLTDGPIAVGAVYVFGFDGTNWSQRAYVKPSNSDWSYNIGFGWDGVVLSADGQTLAVGGNGEESNATGVNGNQHNNDFDSAGAVYLY
jgi:hypothetical protein